MSVEVEFLVKVLGACALFLTCAWCWIQWEESKHDCSPYPPGMKDEDGEWRSDTGWDAYWVPLSKEELEAKRIAREAMLEEIRNSPHKPQAGEYLY